MKLRAEAGVLGLKWILQRVLALIAAQDRMLVQTLKSPDRPWLQLFTTVPRSGYLDRKHM